MYLGVDQDEQIDYGAAPKDLKGFLRAMRAKVKKIDQRKIARESKVSRSTLSRFMQGKTVRSTIIDKIVRTIKVRTT